LPRWGKSCAFLSQAGLSFFKHLRLADFIGFLQWRLEKAESSDVALIIPEYFLVIAISMS
jgi:hypothetical protein